MISHALGADGVGEALVELFKQVGAGLGEAAAAIRRGVDSVTDHARRAQARSDLFAWADRFCSR
ncbi:MAG: hypothetical protein P8166_04990 [Candidatus Thiodiazotropha sp.]